MVKKYVFQMEAYGVHLSKEQWAAVHDVFQNYNDADPSSSERFEMEYDGVDGLVGEILVALGLAAGE